MAIEVFDDLSVLSRSAAKKFVKTAEEAIAERGRFLVSLSGGGTPLKLYEQLAVETLDWSRVHFFWGDERCVPLEDAENNYGQARRVLFDKIGGVNAYPVQSELDAADAAKEYALLLKRFAEPPLEFPRFDLVLLGLGEDGHTASLFPNSPVDMPSPVIAVTAQYQGRPASRVTLTPAVFNQAREVWFLAAGKSKAQILKTVLQGEYSPALYPAQRIRPFHGNLIWMTDKAAASLL